MPPQSTPPEIKPDHMLPPHQAQPVGPILGTVIIVLLLIAGALYFWGARLNKEGAGQNEVPYIPSGTTTRVAQ